MIYIENSGDFNSDFNSDFATAPSEIIIPKTIPDNLLYYGNQ